MTNEEKFSVTFKSLEEALSTEEKGDGDSDCDMNNKRVAQGFMWACTVVKRTLEREDANDNSEEALLRTLVVMMETNELVETPKDHQIGTRKALEFLLNMFLRVTNG